MVHTQVAKSRSFDTLTHLLRMSIHSHHKNSWRSLRIRTYVFWIVFITWIPALVTLWIMVSVIFPRPYVLPIGLGIGATVFALYIWSMVNLLTFRCPSCGRRFLLKFPHLIFPNRRRCVHCGLRRGSSSEPTPGGDAMTSVC